MKKLLFLILFMFLFSCEKETCWRCCTFTRTITGSSTTETSTAEVDTCGLSERQMEAYRKSETKTVTSTANGITTTSESHCNCLVISFL